MRVCTWTLVKVTVHGLNYSLPIQASKFRRVLCLTCSSAFQAKKGGPDYMKMHNSVLQCDSCMVIIKLNACQDTSICFRLLTHFYSCEDQEKATFPGQGQVVPLSLRSTFPSFLFWGGSFAACMAFRETRSLYWKTGAITFVIGLIWVSVKS